MNFKQFNYVIYLFIVVFIFMGCDKLNWNLDKIKRSSFLPVITTINVSNITKTSVVSGGTIIYNGGMQIIQSGLICDTFPNPSFFNGYKFLTTNGTDTGTFLSSISGLTQGTTYYCRAYAINSVDTAYGNQLIFKTHIHDIGENYGGGIIFYINTTGDEHGFIASTSDQTTSGWVIWSNGATMYINATDTAIWAGAKNTDAIIACQGSGTYAASICRNFNGGGYNDWFLPSMNELLLLYKNKNIIGNFINADYWSSSEYGTINSNAITVSFGSSDSGSSFPVYSTYPLPVRAIRAF